jgi:hypothetical protein
MNNKHNNTNNKYGRVLAVPSLCELYPGICLTTEGKARKTLGQGYRNNVTHCAGATFLHVSHFRCKYTLLFIHVFALNMEMRCSPETLLFANRQDVTEN